MFLPVDKALLFSRADATDPRLGDLVVQASFDKLSEVAAPARGFALAGYPDDEGIRINGGRAGAQMGPDAIRKLFYKMTPSCLSMEPVRLFDCGNLDVRAAALGERHTRATQMGRAVLDLSFRLLTLGGGHDYGFADADAFLSWAKATEPKQKPLVINFDAHLDVRDPSAGFNSGTPFRRMLEKHGDVDFVAVGIQSHCNAKTHLDWAQSKGVQILFQSELEASGQSLVEFVTKRLGDKISHRRPTFISVDIDGFSNAFAPGCSQSWLSGFTPQDFFPCFDFLWRRLDVRALGIYEVSPPLDHGDRTSKLAAEILHRAISIGRLA